MIRILCLCCGSYYDSDSDCPNRYRELHTLKLSIDVANYLREHAIDEPRPADVKRALAALD